MPRRVLVQRALERFDLVEVPAPSEHSLQELLKEQVQLLPAQDLGLDGDLLVVGRETTLASGSIDLLCLSWSGDLVLVEFKTGPQNPDFRHALAQVVDYGSDLWRSSLEDFDRGVVQRYLAGPHCAKALAGAADLQDAISRAWSMSEEDASRLRERLAQVLATGDFIYVVAAQRFTSAMATSLDYLNATMRYGRFYLVEVVRLQGQDLVAHAAQVVAAPARRSVGDPNAPTGRANEAGFLAGIADEDYREAMRDVFAAAGALGLTVAWGAKGASLRLPTPDRAEPLSVAWTFLDGDQWYSARHLTLGVDPAALAVTPSVRDAVTAYLAQVGAIEGGQAVSGSLNAHMFAPSVVPRVKDALIDALDTLVKATQDQQ